MIRIVCSFPLSQRVVDERRRTRVCGSGDPKVDALGERHAVGEPRREPRRRQQSRHICPFGALRLACGQGWVAVRTKRRKKQFRVHADEEGVSCVRSGVFVCFLFSFLIFFFSIVDETGPAIACSSTTASTCARRRPRKLHSSSPNPGSTSPSSSSRILRVRVGRPVASLFLPPFFFSLCPLCLSSRLHFCRRLPACPGPGGRRVLRAVPVRSHRRGKLGVVVVPPVWPGGPQPSPFLSPRRHPLYRQHHVHAGTVASVAARRRVRPPGLARDRALQGEVGFFHFRSFSHRCR